MTRTKDLISSFTLIGTALAFLAVGYWVVFGQRWGGVVASVDAQRGVHSGDLWGMACAAIGLLCLAVAFAPRPKTQPVRVRVR